MSTSVSNQILDYWDMPEVYIVLDFISQHQQAKNVSNVFGRQIQKHYKKKKPSSQTIAKMFSLLFKNYKQSPSKVSQPRTDC